MKNKKNNAEKIKKLKEKINEQERVIKMLSNEKIVKGLMDSLEDIKKGKYIILTN
jgi:phage-related tail protein